MKTNSCSVSGIVPQASTDHGIITDKHGSENEYAAGGEMKEEE